jgi:GNAT superfamily N-acetyltransferase
MRRGAMSKRASPVRIRLARPDEREQLEALQWRASLANERDRPHLEANPDAIHLPIEQIESGHVTVAEYEESIAGFAALLPEGSHLELDGLFVEPELRRNGIGAALVEEAAHEARRRGLALMVVANPHALDFYRHCGFSVEGTAETRFGPGIRMSR